MFTQSSNSPAEADAEDAKVHDIVRSGPTGAITVAGIAVALLIVMWFAFYFLVFVPRAPVS